MGLVEKIQLLCNDKKTTLIGLERELEFSRGSIRRWDENFPSVDKLSKVADYFGVTTDYLLGKSEMPGLYLRLAKEAKEMELDEEDVNYIIDFYKRHKK